MVEQFWFQSRTQFLLASNKFSVPPALLVGRAAIASINTDISLATLEEVEYRDSLPKDYADLDQAWAGD